MHFFFVHVMKTGGSTFGWHVRANFRPEELYPNRAIDTARFVQYYDMQRLLSLPEERRRQIRIYMGHFPFVVTELVGGEFVRLTILRDPVERTISFLNHWKRLQPDLATMSLEEIYDTTPDKPTHILNHQAKQFAMTLEDQPTSFLDRIVVDDARLAIAKENLGRVDVIGLQQHYDRFLAELSDRYGWRIGNVPELETSEPTVVPSSFRRRIAQENAADVAFYEYALELYEKRRRHSSHTQG
jgi:hypothetical protein